MKNNNSVGSILLQVGGTNVPPSAEKTIEDQIVGGCFGVLLLFFFTGSIIILGITFLVIKIV
jgi:hypothetical protein